MDEVFQRKLEAIIEAHLEDPDFGVDQMGREIGLSRSQLHRKLRSLTGKSTSRFIRSYKLNRAKALLEKKVGTVSEIAYQHGFSSPAYFSQVFLEEFGHPPSESLRKDLVALAGMERRRRRRRNLITAAVVVAGVAALTLGVIHWWPEPVSMPSGDMTLAVLPFDDMSEAGDQAYYSDGITEDIITALAQVPELKVISRTSVMLYKNSEKAIPEIAKELYVNYIVEGSVRKSGETVRITAQLINTKSDLHMWSGTFDRSPEETLQVQKEIADKIARRLDLGSAKTTSLVLPANPVAYDMFLRGRGLTYEFTKESYYEAIRWLEKAIAADSSFAPAYACLALSYGALGTWIGDRPSQEAYQLQEPWLMRALSLDPHLGAAHSAMAYRMFLFEWDFKRGEQEFLEAYRLDPSDIMNISGYQLLLNMDGRPGEASKWWRIGTQVDPLSFWNYGYQGSTFYMLGEWDKSIDYSLNAIAKFPFVQVLYDRLGWLYLNMSRYEKAIDVVESSMEKFQIRPPSSVVTLALAYHHTGQVREFEKLMNELLARHSARERDMCFHIARMYAGLGDKKQALTWLGQAFRNREVECIWAKAEPAFAVLQDDAGYKKLLSKIAFTGD